jgi:hypothetical protein
MGTERANAQIEALKEAKLPIPSRLDHRTADYVQIVDEILSEDDPYWGDESNGQACWDPKTETTASARHKSCVDTFGETLDPAGRALERDFPILQAYDDKLVIGRYGYPTGYAPSTATREVNNRDTQNQPFLKRMQCCFHNQAKFRVRTGGQWVVFGNAVGYLHHVKADPATGMCVQDCEPRKSLLNARAPALIRPTDIAIANALYRNSPLAVRNPIFSAIIWNGIDTTKLDRPTKVPERDMIWKFSTRGQFVPLIISTTGSTTSVSPQSMRFIDSLGQLALVDGASQGLVLIDLDAVGIARSPYF